MIFKLVLSLSHAYALFTMPAYYEPTSLIPSSKVDAAFDRASGAINGKIKNLDGNLNQSEEENLEAEFIRLAEESKQAIPNLGSNQATASEVEQQIQAFIELFNATYQSRQHEAGFQVDPNLIGSIERGFLEEFDVAAAGFYDPEGDSTIKGIFKGESPLLNRFSKSSNHKVKPFIASSTLPYYSALAQMDEWLKVKKLIRAVKTVLILNLLIMKSLTKRLSSETEFLNVVIPVG